MHDPLLQWRSEFPITERTRYLISNSLGAMPRSARTSVQRYLDLWDTRGVRAWRDEWWALQQEVGDLVARVLGVAPDTVSMHQNVAVASAMILGCFSFGGRRNKVVLVEPEFPSLRYFWEGLRARGAEVVLVPGDREGLGVDQERLLEAIDERTLLVPVSHVLFRTAYVQDAKAIVAKAREVGAFVVLDVFQSVGTLPLALREWGVHAAVGGALKFLCGGPGNCFLYVDPDERKKLTPTFTGWAAHARPFEFAPQHELQAGGQRFAHGTPNVPALYAGREGIRIVADVGVEVIRAKSVRQTTLLLETAKRLGLVAMAPRDPARRGGTVAVDVPDGYAVCQTLNAEDYVCDHRPGGGIRIAPHFYTKDEECVAVLERIVEIRRTRAHERFLTETRRPG